MLHFFAANWGTILIGLLVAAAVALILAKLWRDHKKGKILLRLQLFTSAPHLAVPRKSSGSSFTQRAF